MFLLIRKNRGKTQKKPKIQMIIAESQEDGSEVAGNASNPVDSQIQ